MVMLTTAGHIVAIAAPIGGGKSALSQMLAAALGGAQVVAFDDFEIATRQTASAMQTWLNQGADFNALDAPGLASCLEGARASAGHSPVVFDMPLGRAWKPTQAMIGTLIWLDVPPEVALARRVREIVLGLQKDDGANIQNGLSWLVAYLDNYVSMIRHVLNAQYSVVRPMADLILDGTNSIESNVSQVVRYLERLK
jgi:hypothetical protein